MKRVSWYLTLALSTQLSGRGRWKGAASLLENFAGISARFHKQTRYRCDCTLVSPGAHQVRAQAQGLILMLAGRDSGTELPVQRTWWVPVHTVSRTAAPGTVWGCLPVACA